MKYMWKEKLIHLLGGYTKQDLIEEKKKTILGTLGIKVLNLLGLYSGSDLYSRKELKEDLDKYREQEYKIDQTETRIMEILGDYFDCLCDDHPIRREENKIKSQELFEELYNRYRDFEMFKYDPRDSWDLNYDDYE